MLLHDVLLHVPAVANLKLLSLFEINMVESRHECICHIDAVHEHIFSHEDTSIVFLVATLVSCTGTVPGRVGIEKKNSIRLNDAFNLMNRMISSVGNCMNNQARPFAVVGSIVGVVNEPVVVTFTWREVPV